MSTVAAGNITTDVVSADVASEAVGRPAGQTDPGWAQELSAWRVAVGKSERLNRNLVQYGGSVAALLGISAGGGGVLTLADAVGKSTGEVQDIVTWILRAAVVAAAGMTILVWRTFRQRSRAESDADTHLGRLIELKPDHFFPRPGTA